MATYNFNNKTLKKLASDLQEQELNQSLDQVLFKKGLIKDIENVKLYKFYKNISLVRNNNAYTISLQPNLSVIPFYDLLVKFSLLNLIQDNDMITIKITKQSYSDQFNEFIKQLQNQKRQNKQPLVNVQNIYRILYHYLPEDTPLNEDNIRKLNTAFNNQLNLSTDITNYYSLNHLHDVAYEFLIELFEELTESWHEQLTKDFNKYIQHVMTSIDQHKPKLTTLDINSIVAEALAEYRKEIGQMKKRYTLFNTDNDFHKGIFKVDFNQLQTSNVNLLKRYFDLRVNDLSFNNNTFKKLVEDGQLHHKLFEKAKKPFMYLMINKNKINKELLKSDKDVKRNFIKDMRAAGLKITANHYNLTTVLNEYANLKNKQLQKHVISKINLLNNRIKEVENKQLVDLKQINTLYKQLFNKELSTFHNVK